MKSAFPKKKPNEQLSRLFGEWLNMRGVCIKEMLDQNGHMTSDTIQKQREIEWQIMNCPAADAREVAYKFEVLRDMLLIESINRDALQLLTSIEADLREL